MKYYPMGDESKFFNENYKLKCHEGLFGTNIRCKIPTIIIPESE
jgi:hypothetical protein